MFWTKEGLEKQLAKVESMLNHLADNNIYLIKDEFGSKWHRDELIWWKSYYERLLKERAYKS